MIDTNSTGYLIVTKLSRAFKALGVELDGLEIMKIVDSLDQSRNGRISFSAFLAATVDIEPLLTDKVL